MPKHVGIIPDGNRRWAKTKGLSTVEGHEAGFLALKALLDQCRNDGPKILSFYAFSTENFSRAETEVKGLFSLLEKVLSGFTKELVRNRIRLLITGSRKGLTAGLLKKLDEAVATCAKSSDGEFILNICLNYGGQQALADTALSLARQCLAGNISPDDITTELFQRTLSPLPPVDLLIRTSGEQRISNFMLWECAYAEFYFPNELWPDFTPEVFRRALDEFRRRQRRFGS